MPITSLDQANYNQELVLCNYCGCQVKRSKLWSHKAKTHSEELRAERSRPHGEQKEMDLELRNTIRPVKLLEQPKCVIQPNRDPENWDNSNYPTYNPLVATAKKPVIRGSYYIGFSKKEKQQCREFENARMKYLRESGYTWNPEVEQYKEDMSEPLDDISEYSSCNSEETWDESSVFSGVSPQVTSDEDSFKTCISGDLTNPGKY